MDLASQAHAPGPDAHDADRVRSLPALRRPRLHHRPGPAGLEDPPHDLRHTHATLLLKADVPIKVVSERLGHSSPAFTMATYQHVLPGMQADAARVIEALLAPPAAANHALPETG